MIGDSGHCVFSILELPHPQNEDSDNTLPHGILRVTKVVCKPEVSYKVHTVQILLQQSSPHWMEFFHVVSELHCRKDNLEWEVRCSTGGTIQLKHADFIQSSRFLREVSSLIYPLSGFLPFIQSQHENLRLQVTSLGFLLTLILINHCTVFSWVSLPSI